MGIQAGPSTGLHVHVNVLNDEAGQTLAHREVLSVWVAYAQYQRVLDELVGQPSRIIGNEWTNGLYANSGSIVAKLFSRIRSLGRDLDASSHGRHETTLITALHSHGLCHAIYEAEPVLFWRSQPNGKPDIPAHPCQKKYGAKPPERYLALNLIRLADLGTIEFRQHPGSYDNERVGRWLDFVLAFVQTFRDPTTTQALFEVESDEAAVKALEGAQQAASLKQLFQALGSRVDSSSLKYYAERPWMVGDPACEPKDSKWRGITAPIDIDLLSTLPENMLGTTTSSTFFEEQPIMNNEARLQEAKHGEVLSDTLIGEIKQEDVNSEIPARRACTDVMLLWRGSDDVDVEHAPEQDWGSCAPRHSSNGLRLAELPKGLSIWRGMRWMSSTEFSSKGRSASALAGSLQKLPFWGSSENTAHMYAKPLPAYMEQHFWRVNHYHVTARGAFLLEMEKDSLSQLAVLLEGVTFGQVFNDPVWQPAGGVGGTAWKDVNAALPQLTHSEGGLQTQSLDKLLRIAFGDDPRANSSRRSSPTADDVLARGFCMYFSLHKELGVVGWYGWKLRASSGDYESDFKDEVMLCDTQFVEYMDTVADGD